MLEQEACIAGAAVSCIAITAEAYARLAGLAKLMHVPGVDAGKALASWHRPVGSSWFQSSPGFGRI